MSNQAGTGSFEDADKKLHKNVTFTQLLLLGVSAQIGSGWLFGVLAAADMAGPAAIISWVIAGALIFMVALTYLELGPMLPRSGGIVRYTYLTHGNFSGWIIGWGYWISVVTIPALEAIATLTYLGGEFEVLGVLEQSCVNGQVDLAQGICVAGGEKVGAPISMLSWPNGILLGLLLMVFYFCLNYFGSKLLAESNRWVTLWKIALPVLTFLGLFYIADSSNFFDYGGFVAQGWPAVFQAIPDTGIIFSLIGFRQALDYAGESKNPSRDVPLATIGSIVIPTVIYVCLQIAFIGAISWADMGVTPGEWGNLMNGSWADNPLFSALNSANVALFGALGVLLMIDAAVSPLATGWVYLGTGARTGYGLSIHGSIPKAFSDNNKFGIPWLPLVVSTVVGCLFFFPAPSWYKLVGFISVAAVFSYIMGGVGLPVLRKTAPNLPRPFTLKPKMLGSLISYLAAVVILHWAGFQTVTNLFVAVFIGLPIFSGYYVWKQGWANRLATWALSIVFLALWLYMVVDSGWASFTGIPGAAPDAWSFTAFFITFCVLVLGYAGVLWAICNAEGRQHVNATWWMLALTLATMLVTYVSAFGPPNAQTFLAFPWGTLVMLGVGIVTFYWGVASGFETPEIKEIVQAYEADKGKAGD